MLLQMGHWQEGWPEYEWRWKHWERQGRPAPLFEQPRWGGSPLEGRTILLYAEQGFGDILQFIRYASLVAERGGRVVVACPAPLIELLTTCPGIDCLIPSGGPFPAIDVQAPLLSLPHIFETTPLRCRQRFLTCLPTPAGSRAGERNSASYAARPASQDT